jgi:hypothetical protein
MKISLLSQIQFPLLSCPAPFPDPHLSLLLLNIFSEIQQKSLKKFTYSRKQLISWSLWHRNTSVPTEKQIGWQFWGNWIAWCFSSCSAINTVKIRFFSELPVVPCDRRFSVYPLKTKPRTKTWRFVHGCIIPRLWNRVPGKLNTNKLLDFSVNQIS